MGSSSASSARQALIRRGEVTQEGQHLALAGHRVQVDGSPVELTPTEFTLLLTLVRNAGRVMSRTRLLEQVWGAPADLETRTVDVTIANLRQKIERNPAQPKLIVSVKGIGYAWGPGEGA